MDLASLRSDSVAKKERKFEKKVQFYTKVKETVAGLAAQKVIGKVKETVAGLAAEKVIGKKKKLRSRQKKLKAYDLSTLTEFLPDVSTSKKAVLTDLTLNSKRRHQLVLKEDSQLKAVLNHPVFQSDPLGSIHQHLTSTQPAMPEKPVKPNKDRKKSKAKKSKKSATAPQAMDI